jgi:hypothetical protein
MPRKLKVYQTSQGFYDLAIAAPSMKAALEAWSAASNLFQQGFASESEDAATIDAAMAKPGLVLRRPVGTSGLFGSEESLLDLTCWEDLRVWRMRTGISFSLTPEDRDRLSALVADRNAPQKHVWRARMVLLTADRFGTNAIMAATDKSKSCVSGVGRSASC